MRDRSAGISPEELCRSRTDFRQAVFIEGAARVLRAGRRTFRLGPPPADAAADARSERTARRLGRRNGHVSGDDVRCGGQSRAARGRHRRHGDWRARHGAGRRDRAGANRGGWPRARHRAGRIQIRNLRPSGRGHRGRFGPHRDRRHGDPQRRRRRHCPACRSRDRRRSLTTVRRRQCRRDRT